MSVAGFIVIAFMLTMYVLLDGYDLGVAAIAPFIARCDRERAAAIESIGPFWNGNEVWLIAAGAALFAIFPAAYAASFSGFYLPFIMVLWLLMFRGIALEVRAHFNSELWHQFWDAAFSLSSALLIAVFGIVLGNLLRGLPLDNNGYFRGTFAVLLNPYALLVGLFALAALAMHGAAFLTLRVEGELGARATTLALNIWWGVGALYLAVTVLTLRVHVWTNPSWLQVIPAFSIAALWLLRWSARNRSAILAFVASSCFIVTLMVASAGTLFPYLLPAFGAEERGISIFTAAPSSVALNCALSITIVGIVLVSIYGPFVWRRIAGKIRVE